MRQLLRITAVVTALGALATCGPPRSKIDAIPKSKLHSSMWQLSDQVRQLDMLMTRSEDPVAQAEVVALLAKIQDTAGVLSAPDVRSKHPLMDEEIDLFAAKTARAREAASQTPPNYYFAGTLSGACIYCHDPEGGIR